MCAERRRCDDPHCPLCRATDTPAVAGPSPDLQQAIHAATKALLDNMRPGIDPGPFQNPAVVAAAARIAVEAAAPILLGQLQAAQAENQQLHEAAHEFLRTTDPCEWCYDTCCGGTDPHSCHSQADAAEAKFRAALERHAALGQVDQP